MWLPGKQSPISIVFQFSVFAPIQLTWSLTGLFLGAMGLSTVRKMRPVLANACIAAFSFGFFILHKTINWAYHQSAAQPSDELGACGSGCANVQPLLRRIQRGNKHLRRFCGHTGLSIIYKNIALSEEKINSFTSKNQVNRKPACVLM